MNYTYLFQLISQDTKAAKTVQNSPVVWGATTTGTQLVFKRCLHFDSLNLLSLKLVPEINCQFLDHTLWGYLLKVFLNQLYFCVFVCSKFAFLKL